MQGSQSAFLRTLPRTPRSQSAVRTRSPHSCKPCLGHPVRSPQSALAVRIPTLPLRRPRPQSAVRTRGPHSDRNQRWHMSPPRRPQTCAISDFGRNADCECGLRTANGVYEPEFAGMRIASADCGLRTGCTSQSSQECGLRAADCGSYSCIARTVVLTR